MPETFTTVVEQCWSQITLCVTTITSNSLLLLPVGLGFVGSVIGITKGFLGFGRRRRGR